MKKLLQIPLLLVALFLTSIPIAAHDFEVDGIYYNYIDHAAKTVEVTYYDDQEYTGAVIIPSSVNYGITYSVTKIGDYAFQNCYNLTEVTIPNSVTEIGVGAFLMEFSDYSGLTSVTIGNSVTKIGNVAFSGCSNLTSITIPNSVTEIEGYAFGRCDNLTEVTMGNSVKKIGGYAFHDSHRLRRVNISDLSAWCKIEFENASANPIFWGGCYLYLSGKEIKDLVIPNDITQIKNYTFYNCVGLTSVTIPNSVTEIGDYAFIRCGLDFVTIPNSVTKIGSGAFRDYCPETVVSLNPTPPTCASSFDIYFEQQTLYVPKDSYAKYFIDEEWGKFPNIKKIEATATSISLDKSAITLDKATTETIYATIAPSNASVSVLLWTSDNPAVATVDRTGKVTAISAGTATITATTIDGSNVSASCIVTVNEVKTVVSISQTEANLPVNEIMTLTYTVSNSTNKTATWSTSDENIAYIKGNSSSGSVTIVGVAEGVATITATANDGSGASASCVVNVGVSGIEGVEVNDNAKKETRYDIYGRLLSEPTKGINIIKMSDGSTRKEIVK